MTDIGGDSLLDGLQDNLIDTTAANDLRGRYKHVLFVVSLNDYNINFDVSPSSKRMATFQAHEGPSKFGNTSSIYLSTSLSPTNS
jgi:hypothetical protein